MRTAIALLAGCCAAGASANAQGYRAAAPGDLASRDWSVKASPNLAVDPPDNPAVESFVRSHVWSYQLGGDLCSFRCADLRHNGVLSLVAGIGQTDRPGCAGIAIVDKTMKGFKNYSITGALSAGEDVSKSIEDLHKDGRLELILDQPLGTYGNQCIAIWPVIYAWTGNGYQNVSSKFGDFYERKLSSLTQTGTDADDRPCREAEAAKLRRVLGISATAGLDQAVSLAKSDDVAKRNFAADLLAQIGSPEARRYLEMLAKEPPNSGGASAKAWLSVLSRMSLNPPAQFEEQ